MLVGTNGRLFHPKGDRPNAEGATQQMTGVASFSKGIPLGENENKTLPNNLFPMATERISKFRCFEAKGRYEQSCGVERGLAQIDCWGFFSGF